MVVTTGTASLLEPVPLGKCQAPAPEIFSPCAPASKIFSLHSWSSTASSTADTRCHGRDMGTTQTTKGAARGKHPIPQIPHPPPHMLYPKSHICHPIPLPTLCMLYVTSHIQCPITCPISSVQPPTSCVPRSISCILYPISCLPPPPYPTPHPPPTAAAPPPCPFPINTLSPAMWGNLFYYFQGPEPIMP